MQTCQTIDAMREWVRAAKADDARIGFVPTMGALHAGHRSLIQTARGEADRTVVSIFVNPTQFDENSDLENYPTSLAADLDACREEGVDTVFTPSAAEMYPDGFATFIDVVGPLSDKLCAAVRPGHFRGVCTVVAKLFNIVQPDLAVFGQKDLQQALIIQRMVNDLAMPVEMRLCPTVREPDGLAMSSRNRRLGEDARRKARSLIVGLDEANRAFRDGERSSVRLIEICAQELLQYPDVDLDYADVIDVAGFRETDQATANCVLAVAAFIEGVRLIDHIHLGSPPLEVAR
ncbi:MAG: pantoate--beta-alanine ligase [Planctomycetota bacterium]